MSNKNVLHGLLSICTGMADMALPIVAIEVQQDRKSHRASSYLAPKTSWVPWVELNRPFVLAVYRIGLMVAHVSRILAVVFQPGLPR